MSKELTKEKQKEEREPMGELHKQHYINNFELLLPSPEQLIDVERIAELAFQTGYMAKESNRKEQIAYIILKGLEVGLMPIQSLTQISITQGKPTINADGMRYLIYKNCPTAIIEWEVMTAEKCVAWVARSKDEKKIKFEWTIEEASNAELLGKPVWKKYPKALLKARCTTDFGRTIFPDCIGGISYTPEELEDVPTHAELQELVALKELVEEKPKFKLTECPQCKQEMYAHSQRKCIAEDCDYVYTEPKKEKIKKASRKASKKKKETKTGGFPTATEITEKDIDTLVDIALDDIPDFPEELNYNERHLV